MSSVVDCYDTMHNKQGNKSRLASETIFPLILLTFSNVENIVITGK